MIGDSIEADVRGALNFGMDAIYFNPNHALPPEDIKHQINNLQELLHIL
jgi:putative hydrolase of the HAD superfamily